MRGEEGRRKKYALLEPNQDFCALGSLYKDTKGSYCNNDREQNAAKVGPPNLSPPAGINSGDRGGKSSYG